MLVSFCNMLLLGILRSLKRRFVSFAIMAM